MSEDTAILEIMLELCEEENEDLKNEISMQYEYINYLQDKNKELYKEYNNLLNPDNRTN